MKIIKRLSLNSTIYRIDEGAPSSTFMKRYY